MIDETDQERRALEIFTVVCALSEPDRTRQIEQRCGQDSNLRQQVEALLNADSADSAALGAGAVEGFLQTAIGKAMNVTVAPPARPDQALQSDYRLLRVLGEGGMATVYEAEQQHPRRLVAIKIVRAGSFSSDLGKRFEYEAQVLARLQHPNIAQLYEADTRVDGASICAYLAMELVRGEPIDEFALKKKLTTRQRIELILRVCDAVEYAHRMGVMHRDIKPANILVQEDGQPKVLDFGVARAIDRDERLQTALTHAGQVIGTLPYMSPEQIDGKEAPDTRADVYALGVLLYKLLTGKLPVDVTDCGIAEAARRITHETPALPSEIDRSLRGDLDVIVAKALEKSPERRYRSVLSLANDLRRFLDSRPIEARGAASLYLLRMALWRYRRIAAIVAGFAALLIVFAVYAEIQSRRNQELARQAVAARDVASQNAEQLRRSLYLSNIGFAQAALVTNDIGHLYPLLDGCPEDLRGWEWGYLRELSDRSEQTWSAKIRSPHASDITPDHQRVVMGAESAVVVLSGPNRQQIFSHKFSEAPTTVALSHDGRYVACGTYRDEMGVFDLGTGKPLWMAPAMPAPDHPLLRKLRAVRFSPDGKWLACAGYDGHIRVRDATTGTVFRDIDAQCLSVLCMEFTSDNQRLIGGDSRGHVRMWNLADGAVMHDAAAHDGPVATVAISADDKLVASGASDGKVVVRNVSDWSEAKTLLAGRPIIWSVAFSHDAKQVAAGADDNLVRVWKLSEDTPPILLRGHADVVDCVSFDSSDAGLMSVAADATVKRWDLARVAMQDAVSFDSVATFAIEFLPDNHDVLIAFNDGTIRRWDRARQQEVWRYNGPLTTVRTLSVDTHHGRVAATGDDGLARIVDLRDGHCTAMIKVEGVQLDDAVFSPDGKLLATADMGGGLRLWDLDREALTQVGQMTDDRGIVAIAFHPDGVHLATGGVSGRVRLWKIGSASPIASARPSDTTVHNICFDSSGRWIASAHTDGDIWLMDASSLQVIRALHGHQAVVNGLAFQPGGSRLASGGTDRTVRIWDVTSGAQLLMLHEHRRAVQRLAFSPDGVTLASSSSDGTVQIWSSQSRPQPAQ